MRLATLADAGPDGRLALVSKDLQRFADATSIVPNLQAALDNWVTAAPRLAALAEQLENGSAPSSPVAHQTFKAPLPRAWQWLDGSVYKTHAALMQVAFGADPIEIDKPLMYQGLSDHFYGPSDDVELPSEAHGIDFEGEFGVIVDRVPMGVSPADALGHIKLVVQINDWSLRALAVAEMKTGFGWIHAKPACSIAPFTVTPDELGDCWVDGRVALDLHIEWNGQQFGRANGREMEYGFHELIAHAAFTRDLPAGTIIGSGTISNPNYTEVGSSCIAERRAIETIANGAPQTPFMNFGDRVRMEARTASGFAPLGVIDQKIVRSGNGEHSA